MMTEVAASSSSYPYGWRYHVFLSFKGEDTRYNFTGNLYRDLSQRGIRTFIDDEGIMKGENNTDTPFKVIEESKTAIIVFSENYAFSTFSLEELVHILKCMKGVEGRSIWCVFYDVDPSDVRHKRNSYKDAFDKYEGVMEYKNLVDDWRSALKEAADLCSWHVNPRSKKYEYEIIEEIVEAVSRKIKDGPLYVARHPVALHSQVKEVCSLLFKQPCCDGATMVGIYGPGGIGKTTLARAVYNEIENQFKQYSFFVPNVSEKSINDLLKTAISKAIKEKDIGLEYDTSATLIVKDRLQRKKVLLILDDVDELDQLKILVGEPNWFGSGSKIIITTRDKHLLAEHGIKKIHKVKELNYLDACRLLTLTAFKKQKVDPKYDSIIKRAVTYSSRLPLVLEIIGSSLCGLNVEEWESFLDRYKRFPHQLIQVVLKVSYDGLEEIEREIFLDIACFYKGCKLEYAIYMLQSSHGISPDYCIRGLIDKSLIEIDKDGCLGMHRLIQDMGLEIVRQESPIEPGKRSRLWSYEDILYVLRENIGTAIIQGIKLDLRQPEEVDWSGEPFEKMTNLRVLIIRGANFSRSPKCLPNSLRVLEWTNYPSSCLPSRLYWLGPFQKFSMLRSIDLRGSEKLITMPDLSGFPDLERLDLEGCTALLQFDPSITIPPKLTILNLRNCKSLISIPNNFFGQSSLETLNLAGCSRLAECLNFKSLKSSIEVKLLGNQHCPFLSKMLWYLFILLLEDFKNNEWVLYCVILLIYNIWSVITVGWDLLGN